MTKSNETESGDMDLSSEPGDSNQTDIALAISLLWTPDKENWTEMAMVSGVEYPSWIVQRAERLAKRTNTSIDSALKTVILFVEGEKHTTLADPNQPVRYGGIIYKR